MKNIFSILIIFASCFTALAQDAYTEGEYNYTYPGTSTEYNHADTTGNSPVATGSDFVDSARAAKAFALMFWDENIIDIESN